SGGSAAAVFNSPLPKTLAQLNTWYAEPPEGQNAATYFAKGFAAFQITDADGNSRELPVIGSGTLPPPGTPIPDGTKAVMRDFVQRNDAAWAALQQGVGFEQSRYPVNFDQGSETLLPHLAKIKNAVRFADLKAVLCAADNQPDAAANAELVSLAMAESIKDEPVIISQLVRVACHAIEGDALQRMVNSVALSRDDLQRLSAAFAKAEGSQTSGEGFTRALVGEAVLHDALFNLTPDKLRSEIKSWQNGLSDAAATKMMENLKAQRSFIDETFSHALALRRESFPDRLKLDDYFPARASEARKKGYLLCHMLLSGLGQVTHREAGGLAQLRIIQTAIALEQYRRENSGSYPDSLSALIPKFLSEMPKDPTKGRDVNYRKVGAGYELRCVVAKTPRVITFTVSNPPRPAL